MVNPIADTDFDFAFECGSFGGVKTSPDGHIIPIAKTEPFTPAMNPNAPIPSGGGRYQLKVWENGSVGCLVEVIAGWVKHNPTGALWLGLFACDGNDYKEIGQALQAFTGKRIILTFKLLGPGNRF